MRRTLVWPKMKTSDRTVVFQHLEQVCSEKNKAVDTVAAEEKKKGGLEKA